MQQLKRILSASAVGLMLAALPHPAAAAPGEGFWDRRFHGLGLNGVVNAVVTNGPHLYAAGNFTAADGIAATNIARWDGTNWSALNGGASGEIHAVAVRGPDLFVGGSFTNAGGVRAHRVARWDGTNWSALGSGIQGTRLAALAVDGSGMLYAAGEFTNAGGIAVANIARWDGSNWSALGGGLRNGDYPAWVWTLASSGSNLFAGGFFTQAGTVNANCIAHWNGVTWAALGGGVDDRDYLPQITALAVSRTNLYVGGAFTLAGNVGVAHVARWNGVNWSALGGGLSRFFGEIPVTTLAVSGPEVLVGGTFVTAGGASANHLARWDGQAWSEFAGGASGRIAALQPDAGGVWVGGAFAFSNTVTTIPLARWDRANANSSNDANDANDANGSTWRPVTAGGGQGVDGHVTSLVTMEQTLYAAGEFVSAGGRTATNVARWDGTNWSPLGGGVNGDVLALASNGRELFAGGRFTSAGGANATNIACWNGSDWTPLGPGLNGAVQALAVHGNQLFAGGVFKGASSLKATNLARWDGTNWFALGDGVNGPVHALTSGGPALYAGGRFTAAGGIAATNLARWQDGAWSAPFGGVSGIAIPIVHPRPPPVSALLAVGSDLYVGGDFALAGGVGATNIARWDGTRWHRLGRGILGSVILEPPPTVQTLATMDGQLVAGGTFDLADGRPALSIARWDGTNWWPLGAGVSGTVEVLIERGADLCVGGRFTFAGGRPAESLGIWHRLPQLRATRLGDTIEITWSITFAPHVLEATEHLDPPMWQSVSVAPVIANGEARIFQSLANRSAHFRLVIP